MFMFIKITVKTCAQFTEQFLLLEKVLSIFRIQPFAYGKMYFTNKLWFFYYI